ncbi:MAG: T9SS type A sorting domain-containing protein [Saprospiraceae bacterium]
MRNYLQLIKALSLAALMLFSFGKANASHFMGGDITYVCIGPNQYSIVAKLLRDCTGISLSNTITIDITSVNCGNQTVQLSNLNGATNSYVAPLCDQGLDVCVTGANTGIGVEQYFYRGIVTLPSCANGNDFELSWSTCCRNGIITTGAANQGNYLYATLDNTLAECNSSPAFNFDPTLYFCLGQENNFNQGVTDIDGDELQFSFTDCLDDATNSYLNPVPVPYDAGFSATNPLTNSSISIDANTGQISITPTALQVGVICVLVEEFRSGVKIGETIRDLQVAVIDCGTNDLPIISGFDGTASSTGVTGDYSYTGCVGEEIEFTLESYDAQAIPSIASQEVNMSWGIGISKASFIIDDTTSTLPSATFRWVPTAADVGTNFFTVQIADDACPINGISVFTYKIEVQASGLSYSPNTTTDTILCEIDPATGDTNSFVLDVNQGNFGPGFQFFWTTNTSDTVLSCYNCVDPVFTPVLGVASPNSIITYQIYMLYQNLGGTNTNCVIRDTFTIQVRNCVNTTSIDELIQDVTIAPNPFTTNAILSYNLNQRSDVTIEVFNLVGQKVGTLANEKQPSGEHQIQLGDAINQTKGVYFVRLAIDGEVLTKKVIVQ